MPLGRNVIGVHFRVCFCGLCALCARVGERAPLLWQLPAAEGLERCHCWNGAELFVRARVCLCSSAVVSAMNRIRVLCVPWVWKGIGSDYRKSWHRINSNPHKRGKTGEEEVAGMFRWEEGGVRWTVGSGYVMTAGLMWLCASIVAVCSTFLKQLFIFRLSVPCVLYKQVYMMIQWCECSCY